MSAAVSITEDPVLDFSVSHAEMDLTITNVPMISEWVREQGKQEQKLNQKTKNQKTNQNKQSIN